MPPAPAQYRRAAARYDRRLRTHVLHTRRHRGVESLRRIALLAAAAAFEAHAQSAHTGAPGVDWAGARTRLADAGIRIEASYTGEFTRNRSGGAQRGSANLGELDLKFTASGARAIGVPGMRAFVHVLRTHGDDPGARVGDVQGVSNIAAPPRWRLFEGWVQYNFAAQPVSLLAGRFDLNAEFYHLQSAGLFLHSSFGIGPELAQSGRGGPSIFPESALGVRVESRHEPVVLRAALLNGMPAALPRADGRKGLHRPGDGALAVGEAGLVWPPGAAAEDAARSRRPRVGRAAAARERDGKLALGAWHYTATFDDLARRSADGTPLQHRGSTGAYLVGEQLVFRDAQHPQRRARAFAQLGRGDGRVNRISSYAGLGATFTGVHPARGDDEIGIALAVARSSPAFVERERALGRAADAAERTLELTWLVSVRPWLSVQPGLQRVRNPNADPSLRDATVAQLRFEVVF